MGSRYKDRDFLKEKKKSRMIPSLARAHESNPTVVPYTEMY